MNDDTFKFTIVDPETDEESFLEIDFKGVGKAAFVRLNGSRTVQIDSQQLMEIAALFLAIAGDKVDFSSADDVLDGLQLKGRKQAKELYEALEC